MLLIHRVRTDRLRVDDVVAALIVMTCAITVKAAAVNAIATHRRMMTGDARKHHAAI